MCASAFSVQRVARTTGDANVKKSRGWHEAREFLDPMKQARRLAPTVPC